VSWQVCSDKSRADSKSWLHALINRSVANLFFVIKVLAVEKSTRPEGLSSCSTEEAGSGPFVVAIVVAVVVVVVVAHAAVRHVSFSAVAVVAVVVAAVVVVVAWLVLS